MSAGMVFGQYVPVASPVHALDARTKMVLAGAFTVSLFLLDGFIGLAIAASAVAFAVWIARVPPRIALRGLRTVGLVLAFTLLVHALHWGPTPDALVRLGPLAVETAGLLSGAFFVVRIMLLVVGTSLVSLTTTPVELSTGLERLMRPLAALRLPVEDIAMMLTIALRFIPTTATEAERIVQAQRMRGARFDRGGPIRRAKAYLPVLVPLFVSLFRRAEDLAVAMEARCYRGGPGRTRLREPHLTATDWMTMGAGVAAFVVLAVMS